MPSTATIYINLEDDVSRITERLKREKAADVTLVCPKRCFLFNDSINLRLLKKQTDLLKKDVSILTMDERGQVYAKEAGFKLKFLPKTSGAPQFSDIRVPQKKEPEPEIAISPAPGVKEGSILDQATRGIKSAVRSIAAPVISSARVEQQKETPFELPEEEPAFSEEAAEAPKEFKDPDKPRSHNWIFTTLVILSLLLIFAVAFVVLPKADVVVYAHTEPVTRDFGINMSINIDQPDVGKLHLPATRISQTVEKTDKFQSQGKREMGNPASGTVRIYNFTKAPISLKASTTVLTIGDKQYVFTHDVTYYKPTAYSNAATKEVDAKSLGAAVEIVAKEGGESYNAPAGTRMEITNKVFGSKPLLLYAVVESPVTNGTSRYLSYVDAKDISDAQSRLGESAIKDLQAELGSKDLVLLDKAYTTETVNFNADQPAGAETPTFNATLKVKVTGLAFRKSELEQLVSDRVSQTLPNDTDLKMSDSQLSYAITNTDLSTGTGSLDVHFEGKAVPRINLDSINQELVGKNKEQASEILKSKAVADKIEITLSPTWQKDFPMLPSKINVKVVE